MNTQAQWNHIVETGNQLFDENPEARKAAALRLIELHRESWEGRPRLTAVKQSISLDLAVRAKIVSWLTGDETKPDCEPIYEPVLVLLSESKQKQDWFLLAQICPMFQDKLPRTTVKSALVTAWKKADSNSEWKVIFRRRPGDADRSVITASRQKSQFGKS